METITCIFCKTQQEDRILIRENGFTGRKCDKCGLVYISPRPSLSDIENLYTHDQAQISAESHKSQSFIKRLYARHHLAILRRYASKGSLLEIGAGAGFFLDEARKSGLDVCGIEWNTKQIAFIRNGLNIRCETGTLLEAFDSKSFDIIYHCDVISHFHDPISDFSIMNKRLNPGGILMFETGNGDFEDKYLSAFSSFQYPDHLFFFSEKNIRDLLALTGFELLAIYRWSILPQLAAIKLLRRLRSVKAFLGMNRKVPVQPGDRESSSPESPALSSGGTAKKRLWTIMGKGIEIMLYILRYKVGYIYPRERRPYTLIVVARKSITSPPSGR